MKKYSTVFLQTVVILAGIGAMTALLWEPHLEGRNAHATLVEIYFKDPFLAFVYIASFPFFSALYQGFKILAYVGRDKVFSRETAISLRIIKYCAVALIGFVAAGEIFIIWNHGSDDPAGGIFIGFIIAFGAVIVIAAATVFERILQNGRDTVQVIHHDSF